VRAGKVLAKETNGRRSGLRNASAGVAILHAGWRVGEDENGRSLVGSQLAVTHADGQHEIEVR
tara:strand:- start:2513 stop:2701 length:189 start_codon:yes stop_codon:yes gene_type:complete